MDVFITLAFDIPPIAHLPVDPISDDAIRIGLKTWPVGDINATSHRVIGVTTSGWVMIEGVGWRRLQGDVAKIAAACNVKPEIMNADQGSQFTSAAWITTLTEAGVKISMDGRGRYLDNIFIERLWRSLKQEAVYLHEMQDGFQAKRVIKDWIGFYNSERPHTALDKRSPDDAFFDTERTQKAA